MEFNVGEVVIVGYGAAVARAVVTALFDDERLAESQHWPLRDLMKLWGLGASRVVMVVAHEEWPRPGMCTLFQDGHGNWTNLHRRGVTIERSTDA